MAWVIKLHMNISGLEKTAGRLNTGFFRQINRLYN
jgi:hypothetical protein